MQFTQQLLLNVPTLLLGLIIVITAIIFVTTGLIIVRRIIPHHKMKLHNDVAGAIFNTFGVAYSVLIAFVVVVTWQNFDRSNLNVNREANCLVDLVRDSGNFDQGFRQKILELTGQYADAVINDEWKTMERGESSPRAKEAMQNLSSLYNSYLPRTVSEEIFFSESVRKLNELAELRRTRILDSRTGLHPILWLVLMAGGVATIIFTFLFGSENLKAQILMASLLVIIIGLILFTILLFDFPFTGDVKISPDAFKQMFNF